jgi:ribonuclease HII
LKQSLKITVRKRLAREIECLRSGAGLVVGIDEAGRGPLAGPVVAGAVAVLDFRIQDDILRYLLAQTDDSKKISAQNRDKIYGLLTNHQQIAWGCASIGPRTIEKINILEASKIAMAASVADLLAKLPLARRSGIFCVIDGNFPIGVPYPQESIVGGDAKIFSISAASIIAKVRRDRLMVSLGKKYPFYGFARHKGYPTREHLAALEKFGLTPVHRKSFGPCAKLTKKVIINK